MAKKYPRLASILKRLLFERDIKPVDLARAIDLPPPTVHRLITGKSTRPYQSSLKPIADYFNLEVNQITGEEPILAWGESSPKTPSLERIRKIPVISWDAVGNLNEAIEQSKNKILTNGKFSEKCFALKMNDYSMEPFFPKHTILIFDPLLKPIDRSYILVQIEGKTTPIFRQLLIDLDHKYLKPLNPDLSTYQMRVLTDSDKILGSLFESRINHEADENSFGE